MSVITMVDVDGILCNYNAGIASLVKKLYDIDLPTHPRDITDWYQCSNTIGKERWSVVWEIVTGNPQFLADLPPLATPEEFAMIQSLNTISDVYFVTNRTAFGGKALTEQWLVAHGISTPTVIISSEKGLIASGIGADFFIEDSVENIMDIRLRSPQTKIYLMCYPYNLAAAEISTKCVLSVREFVRDILAA